MKNVRLVLSVASMLIGVIIITGTKLVEEFTVKLGFAAYQAAAAGSYSSENYELDLSLNYWLGSLCIIIGAVFALLDPIKRYSDKVKEMNKEFDPQNKDV
ncbi:hypothetical protein A8990_101344 [Paenibacillus taihuensis]|uniref:Uncharacterized protein n=1 Tax=Paenibacillus taihuensis TaxID=1156355 RepID=A0A3D9SF44_9BACL|nr:hypothetical protein [Paenibacillus taihuensis]REE94548.1 hypothetical protein A8990_101344 [Paenibacillus taihuensis]